MTSRSPLSESASESESAVSAIITVNFSLIGHSKLKCHWSFIPVFSHNLHALSMNLTVPSYGWNERVFLPVVRSILSITVFILLSAFLSNRAGQEICFRCAGPLAALAVFATGGVCNFV